MDLCPGGSATDCLVTLRTRSSVYGALRNPTAALDDPVRAAKLRELVRATLPFSVEPPRHQGKRRGVW